MASSDATERFAASASELGIEVAVRSYPEGTRTAIDAAAAVGCDVDQIVKSLILMADDQPVLVLCSGANRVDLAKVGAEFGGEVRMANADEVRAATGFAIGGARRSGIRHRCRPWSTRTCSHSTRSGPLPAGPTACSR